VEGYKTLKWVVKKLLNSKVDHKGTSARSNVEKANAFVEHLA
jgi:hypothetical protein